MRSYLTSELIQDDSNPASPTPSPLSSPSPNLPDIDSNAELALLQFRRLLADYRRAGHDFAQRLQQTLFP